MSEYPVDFQIIQEPEDDVDDKSTIPKKRRQVLVNFGLGRKKVFSLGDANTLAQQFTSHVNSDPAFSELLHQSFPVLQEFNSKFGTWVDIDSEENLNDGAVIKAMFFPHAIETDKINHVLVKRKRKSSDVNCEVEFQMSKYHHTNKDLNIANISDHGKGIYNVLPKKSKPNDSSQPTLQNIVPSEKCIGSKYVPYEISNASDSPQLTVQESKPDRNCEGTKSNDVSTKSKLCKQFDSGDHDQPTIRRNTCGNHCNKIKKVLCKKSNSSGCPQCTLQNNRCGKISKRTKKLLSKNSNSIDSRQPVLQNNKPAKKSKGKLKAQKKQNLQNKSTVSSKMQPVKNNNKLLLPKDNYVTNSQTLLPVPNSTMNGTRMLELSLHPTFYESKEVLKWGKRNQQRNWHEVIFSGVSMFALKGGRIKQIYTSTKGEMFWSCLTVEGPMVIAPVGMSLTALKLSEILRSKVVRFVYNMYKGGATLQSFHMTQFWSPLVKNVLQENYINLDCWPNFLKNIDPMKFAWDLIASKVKDKKCSSRKEMISSITKVWETDLDVQMMCTEFVSSLPLIINSLNESNGGNHIRS